MANLKEEMIRVHNNSERIVLFAGVTKPNEFEYTHGGMVKPGVEYHIHYTLNKKEVYMTGATHTSSSKIIKKIEARLQKFLDKQEAYDKLNTSN